MFVTLAVHLGEEMSVSAFGKAARATLATQGWKHSCNLYATSNILLPLWWRGQKQQPIPPQCTLKHHVSAAITTRRQFEDKRSAVTENRELPVCLQRQAVGWICTRVSTGLVAKVKVHCNVFTTSKLGVRSPWQNCQWYRQVT